MSPTPHHLAQARPATLPHLLAQLPPMLRWIHATQAAVYALVGSYLAAGWTGLRAAPSIRAALVVWLVVLYGFVVNDYFDIEVDRRSKPDRPIPAGRTAPATAVWLAVALALGAQIWAFTLGPLPAGIALANLLLCAAYSAWLKNTVLLGNAAMALLDSTIVLYGSLALGAPPRAAWLAAGLFALFFFGYEILKTAADREGDGRAGLRTVATRLGAPLSVRLFQLVVVLFNLVGVALWAGGLATGAFLSAFLLCCTLPTLAAALAARSAVPDRIDQGLALLKLVWLSSWLPIMLLR
ncbi:MAG TPA: UbiA family prenyltransferase [Roseiflexaceae bacterium]|nr:UbiA family prenyltransferase [Roseiflexaceae bacterium]